MAKIVASILATHSGLALVRVFSNGRDEKHLHVYFECFGEGDDIDTVEEAWCIDPIPGDDEETVAMNWVRYWNYNYLQGSGQLSKRTKGRIRNLARQWYRLSSDI